MDCSSITDFQQSTAISIAKKFRNLHIGIDNDDGGNDDDGDDGLLPFIFLH